jgi:preprotein translocase subunit SecE
MSKVIQFIKEVRAEFKNITWPKKDTIIQLSIVVISVSAIISIILGGFDYLFVNSIGYLGKLKTQPIKQEILQPTPTVTLNVTPTNYAKHINNNK